jgi:hypothetical protein
MIVTGLLTITLVDTVTVELSLMPTRAIAYLFAAMAIVLVELTVTVPIAYLVPDTDNVLVSEIEIDPIA